MISKSTLKYRLLRNLGANAYGQGVSILIQLVSIPLYLHYWGVALYGEWLILSAIPGYLALSDIGFASVAANDMTMRVANGDRRGALEVYQSIWLFISGVSVLVGIVVALSVYCMPVAAQFSINHISEAHTQQLLLILMMYVLIGLQGGVLNAAFRAAGRYAYGTTLANSVRLAEWAMSTVGLMLGGGVLTVAALNLAVRLLGLLLMWMVLHKQERWLYLGTDAASIQQVRYLLKPAMAFMAFPLGLALSLQGMVLIIGMTLGSAAVVIFSAYRTLTRTLVQVITMLNQAVWPEISAAYGAKNMDLVRQLHRKGSSINFWLALSAVALIGVVGEWFVGLWTHHAFEQNHLLFFLLLTTTFLNVLWQTSWVVLMATNQHQLITIAFILSAASGLVLSTLVIPTLGVSGAGLILVLSELPMLFLAINSALQLVNDGCLNYIVSIILFGKQRQLNKNKMK
jgi:O-antigen/teichoic acid export membrane protein